LKQEKFNRKYFWCAIRLKFDLIKLNFKIPRSFAVLIIFYYYEKEFNNYIHLNIILIIILVDFICNSEDGRKGITKIGFGIVYRELL